MTCLFGKFGENLPRSYFEILKSPSFTREISKFQKSEPGKFIPNFPLKHVITSTYFQSLRNGASVICFIKKYKERLISLINVHLLTKK